MSDILNQEQLGKALGLPNDSDGYDEKSLLALHAELTLATKLVWQRHLARAFERMDKEDEQRKEAAARVKGTEEVSDRPDLEAAYAEWDEEERGRAVKGTGG